MENNNFQNEVNQNEVNQNENQNQVNSNNVNEVKNNKQKNGKTKTIVLVVVVLVLVMVAGILGGLLISGNGNKVTNIVNQGTEKKEENKASKKIDESKPWVYDAEYGKDKENKIVENYYRSDGLKVPYININSSDAEKANEEIKQLYEKKYSEFGTKNSYGATVVCSLEYNYYENNSILSVVIKESNAVVNGGAGKCPMHIYNFNLDTLNKATNDELAKKCGFNSISEVEEKISKWNKRQKDFEKNYPDKVAATYENVVNDLYFIDKDGKLNFVYISVAAGSYYTPAIVEVSKDIEDFYEIDEVEKSYFEQNKNLNYTSNPKDNINGKVAIIKMGEKTFQTTKNNGYYTYKDDFGNSYNIKEITNITSEYRMTSTDGETNLFRAVIEYIDNNNAKKSFDTAVFVPNDANNYITLRICGPYENYTGSTNFVKTFTDLYDDGSKNLDKFIGEYERKDDTERTSGNLTIISRSDSLLSFKINATHVNGFDIEESRAKGAVSIGEIIGVARKTTDNKYEFIPQKDDPEMKDYEGNYKIYFIIKDENTIEVEENYDGTIPYAGAGVSFAGVYNK